MIKKWLSGVLAFAMICSTASIVSAEKSSASSDKVLADNQKNTQLAAYSEYISEHSDLIGSGSKITLNGNDYISAKGAELKKGIGLEHQTSR